jgi:hypothetical protein
MRTLLFLSCHFVLICLSAVAEVPPLQQWIHDAIQAGGGVVTVPPGVHELPAGLVIRGASKLALRGMEKERCILRLAKGAEAKGTQALIHIDSDCETLEIANLTLDGTGMTSHCSLVSIAPEMGKSAAKGITIRDCLFEQSPGDGCRVSHAVACVVERCSFRDCGGAAVRFTAGAGEGIVQGNHVIRCVLAFDIHRDVKCALVGNEEH